MEELSIKIKICGRIYPIKANAADEAIIRKAAMEIDARCNRYAQDYGISDKQDLLAMVAFDCLVEFLKAPDQNTAVINEKIIFLTRLIETTIK